MQTGYGVSAARPELRYELTRSLTGLKRTPPTSPQITMEKHGQMCRVRHYFGWPNGAGRDSKTLEENHVRHPRE